MEWLCRFAEISAGGDQLADRALLNQLADFEYIGPIMRLFGDHEDGACLCGGGENPLAGGESWSHWFFQNDVFAAGEGAQGGCLVEIVGQHDIDGIEMATS